MNADTTSTMPAIPPEIALAGQLTIGTMLRNQARSRPDAIAVDDGCRALSFRDFNERVNRTAAFLASQGVGRGDRVALCSENRIEYLEIVFAAAKLGAIVATLNWRLVENELAYCVELVAPKMVILSERFRHQAAPLRPHAGVLAVLGSEYEASLAASSAAEPDGHVEPEDGLLIIYTSGTTGRPKGALLSHRAEIARMLVNALDFDLRVGDTFVAWPPMFHMIATEQCIHVICLGGTAVIVDGFDLERVLAEVEKRAQWWLVLMPGVVEPFVAAMRGRSIRPKGVRLVGVMADLLPRRLLAELTGLLGAPYANTFGSTETGLPPASAGRIPAGMEPTNLAKQVNALCDYRLVDENGLDVPDGVAGELLFKGPTLFSGYFNASEANAREFRDGWYHMGDMFVRAPDGTLSFADRAKYLIKSGGENIYPAEIERVLLADSRVRDAVVVRRADRDWGEVPIAVVAVLDGSITAEELLDRCRRELAGYKRPKHILFVPEERLPRSTTGKILRHEIEQWSDVLAVGVAS
ncbi:class I adenylate-forming enzyme family protein [Enterovirga sp. CN4-39]|uniref:class I adenylate-forming enzyme family protein n=1 Tax=Enterovirga sp. CN4-39 TaxID=3400910 RepID=UPI003C07AD4B